MLRFTPDLLRTDLIGHRTLPAVATCQLSS